MSIEKKKNKRTALDMIKFPLPEREPSQSFHPSKGLRMRKGGSGRATTKSTQKEKQDEQRVQKLGL